MCYCHEKIYKFTKWSCVVNCCSECSSVFVPDVERNCDKDMNLPFIGFRHYEIFSPCSLQKQLLPDEGKTFPSCMHI